MKLMTVIFHPVEIDRFVFDFLIKDEKYKIDITVNQLFGIF